MGGQVTKQVGATTPGRRLSIGTPKKMKFTSPARSPKSPPRRRQAGGQVSPATSPAPPSEALGLKSTKESKDFVIYHEEEIGEGSFATVKMGKKVSTGERVAVKVIEKRNIPEEMRHLIEHECNILAKLHHKNVIHLHHAAEDKEYIYLYMPYAQGGDLHSFLDAYDYLNEDMSHYIFKQLTDAVDHCHKNSVIHRDIKLENMLVSNANDMHITLIDFGFSVVRKETDPLLDDYPGSPAYAAPELMQGIPYPGYSSDIWAMGVSLYICVTGEYPFWSENRQEMYKQITKQELDFSPFPFVSEDCRHLLKWMLSKDWRERPTIAQIRAHTWYRRYLVDKEEEPDVIPMEDTPVTPCKEPVTPKTPKSGKKSSGRWTPTSRWKKRKLVF